MCADSSSAEGSRSFAGAPATEDTLKDSLIAVAAALLSERPYAEVALAQVAQNANVTLEGVLEVFPSMHAVASVILDREGASMREAQRQAASETDDPVWLLRRTFQLVAATIATRIDVRAGIRIASESRHHFPERRIDPYRTWEMFVTRQLSRAKDSGILRDGLDLETATWIVVAAGMGTFDLVAFHDAWDEIQQRLDTTLRSVLDLMRA